MNPRETRTGRRASAIVSAAISMGGWALACSLLACTATSNETTKDARADSSRDNPDSDAPSTSDAGAREAGLPAGMDAGLQAPIAQDGSTPPTKRTGSWLRGDFHVHSSHSTDAMDSPVKDVIARAEKAAFDYFVITDHDNHVQGNLTTWGDAAYRSDKMALLYGVEWTTGKGHANIFGTKPFDHPALWAIRDGEGAASIAAAHAQGLHFSVNHPVAKDLWEYGFELDYDSMEVWTAVFLVPNSNANAIAKWDELLLAGRRLTARGGSDSHHQSDAESLLFNIGNPTTWVYAREKTAQAVLDGLKAGHVSMSYAPAAERIDFTADVNGDGVFETIVGDNVTAWQGAVQFKLQIVGFRPGASYDLKVIKDGVQLKSFKLTQPTVSFEDTPSSGMRSYYRVEARGDTPEAPVVSSLGFGNFVALTNPIYVAFP